MNIINLILIITCCCGLINSSVGAAIPIKLSNYEPNNKNIEFDLQLPNNDTVKIEINFNLLKASIPYGDEPWKSANLTTTTTTTTESPRGREFFSVEEAIEAFRQELILKEMEIAGIIESERPFYRHFKLEFDENSITVRCTYESNYSLRSLTISCYEYHEFQAERILSNGEVEVVITPNTDSRSDIELIDVKKYKQTYKMTIN